MITDIDTSHLEEITSLIVREVSPDRVILFGSRAWGDVTHDSDVDLLVVMESTDTLTDEVRIGRTCRPRGVPMDVVVRTPAEIKERLLIGDTFVKRILDQGQVLYDRDARPRVG
ncbi:MAG: nucleotidyltransferase domain-containing protein [Gemmatimonadetes bacterium]|jgi:uncharacterized protein|nr:nucleotidyltransferase domain-containing protein [Gemmatimonadota bacterium]